MSKLKSKLLKPFYLLLDKIYISNDKTKVLRSKNILRIPDMRYRKGGKFSYSEWSHVIGIIQTIFYHQLPSGKEIDLLDAGCGTGLIGIAAEPYVGKSGSYLGLDVIQKDIIFCRQNFNDLKNYNFKHIDVANPTYAKNQSQEFKLWPVESESKDLVTALSVWTHLKEEDAVFYFKEISRVLRKNGKAMISFFILDDSYEKSLPLRSKQKGRYHNSLQSKWIFENSAYGSNMWFTPKWVKFPEDAIGVNEEGLDLLLRESGLNLKHYYKGNWKEQNGVYFQDILIFEKV